MLIFIHKYLLIKCKNNVILNKKLYIYVDKKLFNLKYLRYYKYFNLFFLNNYLNINLFFNLFFNLFINKIKPFFFFSKNLYKQQLYINNYISFSLNTSINIIFILDYNLNNKKLKNLIKKNLPLYIISKNYLNKKYFEYYITINNYNLLIEYFFLKFIISIYLSIQNENKNILKKKYFYLNLLNNIKKND